MKYVISRHARQRFVSRFRARFHHSYFFSEQLTDSLIQTLIENGQHIDWWHRVPFYKNKVESKYGPTRVVKSINKNITFICTPLNESVTIVRTVVREFDPRH